MIRSSIKSCLGIFHIRGGITFDTAKNKVDPSEFLFEINGHVTQFVRNFAFDPLSKCSKFLALFLQFEQFEGGSKVKFRTV